MADYRTDPDLEFLQTLKSEELNDLVYCLTHDKDGALRYTESLTNNPKHKKYYPDHHQYWQDIAGELQTFGGNTIVNLFRRHGVLYREILWDVCGKLKVEINYERPKYERPNIGDSLRLNIGDSLEFLTQKIPTQFIEQRLLEKILQEALKNMSYEEIKALATELGIENTDSLTAQGAAAAFIAIYRAGGFKAYQMTVIIVNAIWKFIFGRGLTIGGNVILTKTISILIGPIGMAITALWTVLDIAGPAYRVTIPATIQVAYLRSLSENREQIESHSST